MSDFEGMHWQPLSQLPIFQGLIGGMTAEVQAFLKTLTEARTKPQALDDQTLDRIDRQYQERLSFLDLYDEQFRHWRTQGLTPEQAQIIDGFSREVAATRSLVAQVLTLAAELRAGSIDRVHELSDEELGLMTLLGLTPAEVQKLKRDS